VVWRCGLADNNGKGKFAQTEYAQYRRKVFPV